MSWIRTVTRKVRYTVHISFSSVKIEFYFLSRQLYEELQTDINDLDITIKQKTFLGSAL